MHAGSHEQVSSGRHRNSKEASSGDLRTTLAVLPPELINKIALHLRGRLCALHSVMPFDIGAVACTRIQHL